MARRKLILIAASFALMTSTVPATAAEKEYRVGYIADLSGPFQGFYKPIHEAFSFYIRDLNGRGGINGVPVKLIARDDQLKATRAASLVVELTTSEKVNSIWGMSVSRTHMAVYRQAQRYKVPALAMFSGIKPIMPPKALPYGYSLGHVFEIAGQESARLAVKQLKSKGKLACTSIEAPGGVAACKLVAAVAKANGSSADYVLFPPRTTSFAPIGQKLAAMQPTVMVSHAAGFQNPGIIRSLREAGFKGPILMGSHGLIEANLVKALKPSGYLTGLQIVSRFASPDSPGADLDKLRAAAKKFGKSDPLSTPSVMGWSMGKVLEAALTKCGWPCPGSKLNATLQTLSVPMGDLMGGPITFTKNDHYGPSWWRVYQYDPTTGKFAAISDWLKAEPLMAVK